MQRVFPDFPVHGKQDSERFSYQISMRSTLTSSMVNEVRTGRRAAPRLFSPDLAVGMYSNAELGNMSGYGLNWGNFKSIRQPLPVDNEQLS